MKRKKVIRQFSEPFKREKVDLIEKKQYTVKQISKLYEVSERSVYKWIRKYSREQNTERVVVEKESEGYKTMQLMKKVAELERTIGQKQLEIDFLNKIIEFGKEDVGYDFKKKYLLRQSNGSGGEGKSTGSE
jgi:transposase-like protein